MPTIPEPVIFGIRVKQLPSLLTEPGIYAVTVSHPSRCPGYDEVAVDFLPSKLTLVIPALVCVGDSVDIKITSQLSLPFDITLQSSIETEWSYTELLLVTTLKLRPIKIRSSILSTSQRKKHNALYQNWHRTQ